MPGWRSSSSIHPEESATLLGSFKAPPSQLKVTGVFDNATRAWIIAFQTAVKADFQPNMLIDGLLDPARDHNSQQTSITHATYCIAL